MVEATAEKSEQEEKQQSPEEIAKDEAAAELLKELENEEADEPKDDDPKDEESKDDKSEDTALKPGEDEPESQSGKKAAPKKKKGFENRLSRLVKQRNEVTGEKEELAQKLTASEEEKKLLRMRLEQLQGAVAQEIKEPNPDDFDGGELDPDFKKQQRAFDLAETRKIVREEAANISKTEKQKAAQAQKASELKRKQEEHWKNADALGAKDYDQAEGKAIDVLGVDMVNNIIDYFPEDSHKVLYYLGLDANSVEAEDLSEMFSSGQEGLVKGVAKVGRIIERIGDKPFKTSIAPDPDEEIPGSTKSAQEGLQLKLDKLREEAAKGRKGGMKRIMELKKKAADRGITLR